MEKDLFTKEINSLRRSAHELKQITKGLDANLSTENFYEMQLEYQALFCALVDIFQKASKESGCEASIWLPHTSKSDWAYGYLKISPSRGLCLSFAGPRASESLPQDPLLLEKLLPLIPKLLERLKQEIEAKREAKERVIEKLKQTIQTISSKNE